MVTIVFVGGFLGWVALAVLVYKLQTGHGFWETLNRDTGLKGWQLVILIAIVIYVFCRGIEKADVQGQKESAYEYGYDVGYEDGYDDGYSNDKDLSHYDDSVPNDL